jgi:hypothetical protein
MVEASYLHSEFGNSVQEVIHFVGTLGNVFTKAVGDG